MRQLPPLDPQSAPEPSFGVQLFEYAQSPLSESPVPERSLKLRSYPCQLTYLSHSIVACKIGFVLFRPKKNPSTDHLGYLLALSTKGTVLLLHPLYSARWLLCVFERI